ncbi:MFS transporter [Saccharopolyspora indica]|uniref:MFS transporter n=1 Tax=Saccharopolyspora indica TaxID=1229659 RepID=UPI0022EB00F2|nr:MFS transporter [Saccharopolyspora indica]MDA3649644.1 MFS transporter [Saccharopolyspora indica]
MRTTRSRAGRREWAGLAVLSLPMLLLSINNSALHLVLPTLSADLAATGPQLLWIVDAHGFATAALLITMGSLGDRIGHRGLLLAGTAAFGTATVLAAFAPSAEVLVLTRALAGAAGAALMPTTLALLRAMFQVPEQRAAAISWWVTGFIAGNVLGPVAGGLLLELAGWRSVFLLGVPVLALLLVTGPFLLPEQRDRTGGKPDFTSSLLSAATVVLFVYGLKELSTGSGRLVPGLAILGGLVLGWAFVRRQRRSPQPMLDLSLLGDRAFTAPLLAVTLMVFTTAGTTLLLAQHLQGVLGLPPLQAAIWLLPSTVAGIALSAASSALTRRFRPTVLLTAGLLVAAAGTGLLAVADGPAAPVLLVIGMIVLRLGAVPVMTASTSAIIDAVPAERAGSATALKETCGELGIALGVTVLGSIGAAAYRSGLGDAVPGTAGAEAAEAARGGIGAAVELAARLPRAEGGELLDRAREAWTAALHVSTAVGTAVLIGAALLVWRAAQRKR